MRIPPCFYCGWSAIGSGMHNGRRRNVCADCRKWLAEFMTKFQRIKSKTGGR